VVKSERAKSSVLEREMERVIEREDRLKRLNIQVCFVYIVYKWRKEEKTDKMSK
jgi:hypothetical protein